MIGLLGLLHIDEVWVKEKLPHIDVVRLKQKLRHTDEIWFKQKLPYIDEVRLKQKLPHIDEVRLKQATGLEDTYLENFFAPFFFSFSFLEFSSDFVFNSDIMAKGGDFAGSDLEQGERNIDFPMTIRPNQSVLVNELKSKFDAIDQRFDTVFGRLNGNGNNLGDSSPKPVISNSESQIIYNQIWEVLEQWTGRHTQNY